MYDFMFEQLSPMSINCKRHSLHKGRSLGSKCVRPFLNIHALGYNQPILNQDVVHGHMQGIRRVNRVMYLYQERDCLLSTRKPE